jgi:hypothetical protein
MYFQSCLKYSVMFWKCNLDTVVLVQLILPCYVTATIHIFHQMHRTTNVKFFALLPGIFVS